MWIAKGNIHSWCSTTPIWGDWLTCIGELLGSPIKTEAQPVTDDIVQLTEDFGEIFDHQTLFYREIDTHRIMAMFWPWKDQPSTNVKNHDTYKRLIR